MSAVCFGLFADLCHTLLALTAMTFIYKPRHSFAFFYGATDASVMEVESVNVRIVKHCVVKETCRLEDVKHAHVQGLHQVNKPGMAARLERTVCWRRE